MTVSVAMEKKKKTRARGYGLRVLRAEPRRLLGDGQRLKIVGRGILENVNGAAGQHTQSRAADYEIHKGPARRNKGARTREDARKPEDREREESGRTGCEKEREKGEGGRRNGRIIDRRRKGRRDEAAG